MSGQRSPAGIGWQSLLVLLVLMASALAGHRMEGPERLEPAARIGIGQVVPESMGLWQRQMVRDPSGLPEAAQANEFFQAMYRHPDFGPYSIMLEYTADSRRRYELHYPDVCHSVRGDRIVMHSPLLLDLGESAPIEAALMEWQHPDRHRQAYAAYWYVTRKGVTTNTMKLKWAQALAGLLRKPEAAVLVRIDAYFNHTLSRSSRQHMLEGIDDLARSLHAALDESNKNLIFTTLEKGAVP